MFPLHTELKNRLKDEVSQYIIDLHNKYELTIKDIAAIIKNYSDEKLDYKIQRIYEIRQKRRQFQNNDELLLLHRTLKKILEAITNKKFKGIAGNISSKVKVSDHTDTKILKTSYDNYYAYHWLQKLTAKLPQNRFKYIIVAIIVLLLSLGSLSLNAYINKTLFSCEGLDYPLLQSYTTTWGLVILSVSFSLVLLFYDNFGKLLNIFQGFRKKNWETEIIFILQAISIAIIFHTAYIYDDYRGWLESSKGKLIISLTIHFSVILIFFIYFFMSFVYEIIVYKNFFRSLKDMPRKNSTEILSLSVRVSNLYLTNINLLLLFSILLFINMRFYNVRNEVTKIQLWQIWEPISLLIGLVFFGIFFYKNYYLPISRIKPQTSYNPFFAFFSNWKIFNIAVFLAMLFILTATIIWFLWYFL